jgi:hypothetical protein
MSYIVKVNCSICNENAKYTEICNKCENIWSGIEDYYDEFYPKSEEAIKVLKEIRFNKSLLSKAMSYRKKGKYIPNSFIETIIKRLKNRHI